MILTLTSDTYSQGELYDFASTQLAQTIAQIDGVGDVDVGGSSLPRGARRPQPAGAVQPGRVAGRGAHRHQRR